MQVCSRAFHISVTHIHTQAYLHIGITFQMENKGVELNNEKGRRVAQGLLQLE